MSSTGRLCLGFVALPFGVVVLGQARAAWRWAGLPWPGFTVLQDSHVRWRHLADLPEEMQPLAERAPLQLREIQVGGPG